MGAQARLPAAVSQGVAVFKGENKKMFVYSNNKKYFCNILSNGGQVNNVSIMLFLLSKTGNLFAPKAHPAALLAALPLAAPLFHGDTAVEVLRSIL